VILDEMPLILSSRAIFDIHLAASGHFIMLRSADKQLRKLAFLYEIMTSREITSDVTMVYCPITFIVTCYLTVLSFLNGRW